jgi:hypothetical protein
VLHHLPLAVSYAYLDTNFAFCDPTFLETAALSGSLTFFVNVQSEICGIYKNGGKSLPSPLIEQLVDAAVDVVNIWHRELMEQMGSDAPQMLKSMVQAPREEKRAPQNFQQLEREIVMEMRGNVEQPEDDEDEELPPSLLALFQ